LKIHLRITYQSRVDRMLLEQCWHSATSLDNIRIGDILRIKNKETLEIIDWKVTELPIALSLDKAKAEWFKYPFDNRKNVERYGYFPWVIRNLEKIKEYPPIKPSPRYIPSPIRIKVWLRDGAKCKRCGAKEDLGFEHIVPIIKGGSNVENNIELICRSCSKRKSDRI